MAGYVLGSRTAGAGAGAGAARHRGAPDPLGVRRSYTGLAKTSMRAHKEVFLFIFVIAIIKQVLYGPARVCA